MSWRKQSKAKERRGEKQSRGQTNLGRSPLAELRRICFAFTLPSLFTPSHLLYLPSFALFRCAILSSPLRQHYSKWFVPVIPLRIAPDVNPPGIAPILTNSPRSQFQPHADSSYFFGSTKAEIYPQLLDQTKGLLSGQRNWVSVSNSGCPTIAN